MKTALKAAMLVIAILFLAVALYTYGQVTTAMRLTDAAQLNRAICASGAYVGSASLAGLCFVAYAVLRREGEPKQ